ncbi:MAG: type I methionyl aminopeptidase [Firmicutes bacterium]|nr:type I methionyl aminopeptidase [Bacillota bacterium]
MIQQKSAADIRAMEEGGAILKELLALLATEVKPGIQTRKLDGIAADYIRSRGAQPSFLGYDGFKGTLCVSIDEEVIHGIPGAKIIREGDLVKVDAGVFYKGLHTDAARTFLAGEVSADKRRLAEVAKECFFKALEKARPGARMGDVSHAVQVHAEANGFSAVRDYTGHGIGANLHEDPSVPNFGQPGRGIRLTEGMTIAIEPMINAGGHAIRKSKDGWTIVAADRKPSAHYENTVAITAAGARILTE